MGRRAGCIMATLVCLLPRWAGAQPQPSTFKLDYRPGPSSADCPDEQEFREAVRAAVGRDPFVPGAPTTISVGISQKKGSFRWELRQLDADGQPLWTHAPFTGPRCAGPLETVVFSLKTRFFPITPPPPAVTPPIPTPPPPPTRPETPAAPAPSANPVVTQPPPSVVAPPSRGRPLVRIGNGAWALFGVTPALATLGASIDVGLRLGLASIAVEGRASLPGSFDLSGTRELSRAGADHFTVSSRTATLVPCVHYRLAVGCGLAQIGELSSASTATASALQAAVGARLGVEIPLLPHLHARIAADLLGTTRAITVCRPSSPAVTCAQGAQMDDSWSQPRVLGALGAGVVTIF